MLKVFSTPRPLFIAKTHTMRTPNRKYVVSAFHNLGQKAKVQSQHARYGNSPTRFGCVFTRPFLTGKINNINMRYLSTYTEADRQRIAAVACETQTPVSLQTLLRTGRGDFLHKTFAESTVEKHAATELVLRQVASFLRRELPVRMARRVADLESIPVLRDMNSVLQVKDAYIQSCMDILNYTGEINSPATEEEFSRVIEAIYERHGSVLVQMARGAYEFRQAIRREKGTTDIELEEDTHAFLDRFYLCRIGIRVLIGQYLALRHPPVTNYIGIICSQTSPYEIVKRAIDDAAFMCTRKYGDAPEVIITGRLDLTFPYVPTHLRTFVHRLVPDLYHKSSNLATCFHFTTLDYILLELIKNSMRATVEFHGMDGDFPPIKVVIADGKDNEDVVIKVSDEGGGIPRSNMKKIWSYLFTTADPSIQEGMIGSSEQQDHGRNSPLAGLGYGLPISRSYCRYFGGDLSIMSMEGYGTDAFVYLTRLGNTREPLPI
jgi:pyruvate dehydrogenase kinase 2/3/4